jgi:hypothetical protein
LSENLNPLGICIARDAETYAGIAGVKVTVNQNPPVLADSNGFFPISGSYVGISMPSGLTSDETAEKDGYQTTSVKLKAGNLCVIDLQRKK